MSRLLKLFEEPIPLDDIVKYLVMYFFPRITWSTRIVKRKETSQKSWLFDWKSKLSLTNKLPIIPKAIWFYEIQVQGTTRSSNIDVFQSFQNKTLIKFVQNFPIIMKLGH